MHTLLREIDGGSARRWVMLAAVLTGIVALIQGNEPLKRTPAPHVVRIRANSSGHYYANVIVNGVPLRELADTGSTTSVFSLGVAERMGFDPKHLVWNSLSTTANGVTRGADVKVNLTIGGVTFHNVNATITQGDLTESLLGIDFLNSLRSWHTEKHDHDAGVLTMCLSLGLICEKVFAPFGITHKDPVVTKVKCRRRLWVGKPVTISVKTKFARVNHVSVTQAEGSLYDSDVPPNFKIKVTPIGVGPVRMDLTLEPRRPSAHLIDASVCKFPLGNAVATPPKLRIKIPWRLNVGDLGLIGWKAPTARKFALEIDDGENPTQEEHRRIHATLRKFEKPGRRILRFIAWDEHALTAAIRVIHVRQSAPRIRVESKIECARAGERVSFAWHIKNAEEAWLEELFANRREKVDLIGTYTTQVDHFTREFMLVAKGPGGITRVRLKAVPWIGLGNHNQ